MSAARVSLHIDYILPVLLTRILLHIVYRKGFEPELQIYSQSVRERRQEQGIFVTLEGD